MAIYTKLDKEKVVSIISNYNLGNMKNYKGIDHKFFPLDNPIIIRRFLNIWKPKLLS